MSIEHAGNRLEKGCLEYIKDRYKNYYYWYPEKYSASIKCNYILPKVRGNHLHHWSYSEELNTDLIELTPKDHRLAHKNLVYDQPTMFYKTLDGELLDTKEKHLGYLVLVGCKTELIEHPIF